MHDWTKYKIGIALSGGGAKGAYEIGCWEALSKAKMSFAAIAGTSIGGVNGYLMSLGDVNKAKAIWIEMSQNTPLKLSLPRLLLVFLERLGIANMMVVEILIFLPLVALFALIVIGVPIASAYLISPDVLYPLAALIPPLIPLTVLALTKAFRRSRIGKFTRGGVRYSLRDARRDTRQLLPLEFAVLLGLALGIAPEGMVLYTILTSGRSWAWGFLLLPCLALNVLGIILSSDVGFSSPGELSLFSTERLEELLVKHGRKELTMPSQPRLYIARMREEVVSLPGSVPDRVSAILGSIMPNKRWEDWTTEDLANYRQQLSTLGLDPVFTNSTAAILGLEYVQLAGRPVLEAADSVLSTSAIADALGRVQERVSGIEQDDFILRGMRAEFYDPGLVDNTPIAPLLQNEECNLIVVIFLDHRIRHAQEYLEKHLKGINAKLRSLNPDLDDQTYEALLDFPFLKPIKDAPAKLHHVEILPVIPSQPLGRGVIGFLLETLWFRGKRIRELIKLGFDDTELAIKKFVESQSTGSTAKLN